VCEYVCVLLGYTDRGASRSVAVIAQLAREGRCAEDTIIVKRRKVGKCEEGGGRGGFGTRKGKNDYGMGRLDEQKARTQGRRGECAAKAKIKGTK
jgi:hypothetical protein